MAKITKQPLAISLSNLINAGERLKGSAQNVYIMRKHGSSLSKVEVDDLFNEMKEAMNAWSKAKANI